MDDNRKTLMESLASAMVSTDLTIRAGRCDADYLIALGWTAHRINPIASTLVRLHLALDPHALKATIKSAQNMAWRISKQRGWKLGQARIKEVGMMAARHYVVPVCGQCVGRKFESDKRSGALLPIVCRHCSGTGEEPWPRGTDGVYVRSVVAALESVEREAGDAVRDCFRAVGGDR